MPGDFEAGRIVSLLSFPAFYATMKDKDLPFEVGVAPWPVVAGGNRITAGSFAGWIVNPNKPDDEREESWKFLAWMLMIPNDAMGVEVGKYGTAITWPNQWHDDFIASDDNWRPFYETQQYAVPALLHARALEVKDQVMSAISRMILAAQNVLWADFGNYNEDNYAWLDRIGVGDDGKHTTQKRAEYDEEAQA